MTNRINYEILNEVLDEAAINICIKNQGGRLDV